MLHNYYLLNVFLSFYVFQMEDKEKFVNHNAFFSTFLDSTRSLSQGSLIKPRRKLIRRNKKSDKSPKKSTNKINKLNAKKKKAKQINTIAELQQINPMCEKERVSHEIKHKQDQLASSVCTQVKLLKVQKLQFDIKTLPEHLQAIYKKKEKIKNTELVVSGVKFVKDLDKNPNIIKKWLRALIIYQQSYKENQRCHFGLILKFDEKIISFDGIKKLWPISNVQKSFHWQSQPDTWSCGYRVLFWLKKIQEIGLQRWVQQFQNSPNYEDIEIDY